MTNQVNTMVRLVRCPRCRLVLPELAEVPVYECGGCGTVLQAKNRKKYNKDMSPRSQETDPTHKSDLEHVSEDSSLNQQTTVPSSNESAFDNSSESDQNKFGCLNHSDELPSSTELTCHENTVPSPEAMSHMEAGEDKCPLDQYDSRDKNELGEYAGEKPGGINFSDEVSSSTERNCHESKSSSPVAGDHIEVESKYSLEQNDGTDQNEFGDCSREWPGNIKVSKEIHLSTEFTCHEPEEPSQVAGADTEVDENLKSRVICRSSSGESYLDMSQRDSFVTAQRSFGESILSDDPMSPSMEQMNQTQNGIIFPSLERVSSVDTLENIPPVNPTSKLGVTLGDMPKSPTTRSYYAYDGSESSCYETDYQVPSRHFHASKRNFKDAEFFSTKGLPKRDEFVANESEMQHQAMHPSSIFPGKKHNATKGSKWHQDEFPVRSMMRLETNEHLSRLPLHSRGSQAGPSSSGHNNFQHSSIYHSPDKPEYHEANRVELLRMVYELQDQLNRKYIPEEKPTVRFSARVPNKDNHISSYRHHFAAEREIYPDLNSPRYPGRYNQGKSGPQQCRIPRMAFSGETPHCRHQVDCSCLNCRPQERHFSAQLPTHFICCNKGHYTADRSHNCYSPCHSGPTSPPQFTGSEFSSWSRETKSDEVKRLNLREKHHPVKRHFRPIAGASPIIACYGCSALLQMPADFLLFKRRCHRLRCSSCSEVLKFSLKNRIQVARYVPDAIAPPPSEVDDYTDAIKNMNLASASLAEPISCSDDYGLSFCKSCSTEGSIIPPFHTLERDPNDRKMSSVSSSEPVEERKKKPVLKESQDKYKNPVETFDSAGPSSKREKPSSEIEELRGSPLHQLMGYSSPSKVISR